jgi:rubredoxin
MDHFKCKVCGYVYDPERGDASQSVTRNTAFESLPDDWVCPDCNAEQYEFELVDECDRVVGGAV